MIITDIYFALTPDVSEANPFEGILFDCVVTFENGNLEGVFSCFENVDERAARSVLQGGYMMWVPYFHLPDEMVDEYSDEDGDWGYDMADRTLQAINLIFGIPENSDYDGPEAIFDLKVATLDDIKIEDGYHHCFHVYKDNGEWISKEIPLC